MCKCTVLKHFRNYVALDNKFRLTRPIYIIPKFSIKLIFKYDTKNN